MKCELSRNTVINTNATLPHMNSTPEQLRFASIPAHTVRADFAGGGLSSDFGPMLLRGVDLQIGLTERITAALPDRRHASYISHSYHDLLTQRIYQIGCGYEDGNDSNSLRHDPMFKRACRSTTMPLWPLVQRCRALNTRPASETFTGSAKP